MDHNPFAPPSAPVSASASTDTDRNKAEVPFFAVSIVKLMVLSLSTFGAYEVFWFYKNWKLVRLREGSDIWPFWRALFGVLFCYAYFKRFQEYQAGLGHPPIRAGALATGWIVTCLLANAPDPFWLIGLFSAVFLIPVQIAANRINTIAVPGHDGNSRFSIWN